MIRTALLRVIFRTISVMPGEQRGREAFPARAARCTAALTRAFSSLPDDIFTDSGRIKERCE